MANKPPKHPVITPETFGGEVDDVDQEIKAANIEAASATIEDKPGDEGLFSGTLTEAEKKALMAEARKEVSAAVKTSKMKEFKAQYKKQIMAANLFGDAKDAKGNDVVNVALELASYPKWIMLDGKRYHSGRIYAVNKNVAAVLYEQMERGWGQEEARLGDKSDLMEATRRMRTRKVFGKNGLREEPIYT